MDFKIVNHRELNIPIITSSLAAPLNTPENLIKLIHQHRVEFLKLLAKYGALLFRSFACQDVDHFSQAIEACNLGDRCSTKDYEIARTILANEIYTSSDLPAHIFLPLHHEKPRTKNPPSHIYFCCNTPAREGGATLFGNAGAIWHDMPEEIQQKIMKHGIVYKQFFHGKSLKQSLITSMLNTSSARTWMDYFGTVEKKQIEERLNIEGLKWEWVNGGTDLIVLNFLPGAVTHPVTHQTLWFNSAGYLNYYSNLLYGELKALPTYSYLVNRYLIAKDMLPIVCHYGNNTPFSSAEILQINQVIDQHTYPIYWHAGDFMIVDNFTFMHGKEAHSGKRLVYGCMTQAYS
ncbi:regulatory protein, SyrP-like protein [Legionella moravica]|uniref:Regulatory protein, SyrP-like protein n=1 Tax=Legionella moravica TaxID=39962 RepID=A0A378JYL6_9GAMM|nr:TauD/TfdA family dioxygenase [Legionella moravica]KTD37392.1 regulatory protein, SyrP-like protein [Legionella moravica]STX63130.1 regulatory protein, SyrP-like protein [Legionella moravica]